jgi:hypothetical protein
VIENDTKGQQDGNGNVPKNPQQLMKQ